MKQKYNSFSIIPDFVKYDKRLTPLEKLLYSEILSLTSQTGECWASNLHLANLYGVSMRWVQNSIQNLIKLGFIKSRVVKSEGNKRYLTLTNYSSIPHEVEFMTLRSKVHNPLRTKVPHNNISVNNINNNNNEYKHSEIFNVSEKTFSEKTDITETVIEEIALQNNLPIHFVEAQWKLAKLYLDSNGIKKTNHKAYLETWVLKEKLRIEEKQNKESVIADFRNIN